MKRAECNFYFQLEERKSDYSALDCCLSHWWKGTTAASFIYQLATRRSNAEARQGCIVPWLIEWVQTNCRKTEVIVAKVIQKLFQPEQELTKKEYLSSHRLGNPFKLCVLSTKEMCSTKFITLNTVKWSLSESLTEAKTKLPVNTKYI